MGRRPGSRNKPLDQASIQSLKARLRRIGQQDALVKARLGQFERQHPTETQAIRLLQDELGSLERWQQRVREELYRRERS